MRSDVGAACPLGLAGTRPCDFPFDFVGIDFAEVNLAEADLAELNFGEVELDDAAFFFFLDAEEAVCAAAGRTDAVNRATLVSSAAINRNSRICLVIVFPSVNFETLLRYAPARLLFRRGYGSSQIHRIELIASRASHHLEQNVLSRFQSRDSAAILGHRVDGRMIDFGDDISAHKSDILGKTCRIHCGNERALHIFITGSARAIASQVFQAQTEFGRRRSALASAGGSSAIREKLGAIRNRDGGFVFFLVAHVRNAH
jgi:hypothetical protein